MEAKDKARMPVLPDWVKLPDQRTAVRKWAVRHYSAVVGYHAVRLPLVYTPKICMYSPRGAWRWSTAIGRWVSDAEGKSLRLASVANEDAAEYLKLSRQRNDRVRLRGIVATVGGFVGLAAALTLFVMAPSWLLMLAVATLATTLGVVGAPHGPAAHRHGQGDVPQAQVVVGHRHPRTRGRGADGKGSVHCLPEADRP